METQIVPRALVLLGVTLLLAAGCSVANPFSPSSVAAKQRSQDMALKWAQCMRQHGVNMPDPVNGVIRAQASPGPNGEATTLDPNSQQFQDAQNACKQYSPNGGQAGGAPSQAMIDAATKYAQCMRSHGVPIQDPNTSGGGIAIEASPGAFDPNSDQFKQAQSACQHYLNAVRSGGS